MFTITLKCQNGESKNIQLFGLNAEAKEQVIRIAKVEPGAEWLITNGLYGEDINTKCPKGTCEDTRCDWCVRNSHCYNCGKPWGYCADISRCQEESMASYQKNKQNGRKRTWSHI